MIETININVMQCTFQQKGNVLLAFENVLGICSAEK